VWQRTVEGTAVAQLSNKGVIMKANSTQIRIGVGIIVWSFLLIVGSSYAVQAQYPNQYPNNQYPNNPGVQDRRDDRYGNRNRRGRSWDNYGNYGGSFQLRQTALNAGYNEGMKDGTAARSRNRNTDFASQNAYRKATKDYSSRLGDRELYRRYFREAYETGFRDGFNPGGYDNVNNRDWNRGNREWDRNRDGNWDTNNRRGRNWDRYDNYGGTFDLRQTALNAGYNEGIKEGRNDRNSNRREDFRNNSKYREATTDYSDRLGDRELYRRYYRAGYENGYYDGLNGN
jgi:hypothetical protein